MVIGRFLLGKMWSAFPMDCKGETPKTLPF
jgi:hypothetical protein